MPDFPPFRTKPYYDALKTWLTTALNEDGTLKSSAVQSEVSAAIANNQTVVDAAAAAVDAEPRIADLNDAKDRVDALLVDVERFVPVAATRADAWQAAIDTAFAQGGGTVTSSLAGTHTMSKGLTLRDGVYIDLPGSGSVHLDFTGATVADTACIYGTGSLTALPALSVAASKDGRTLTFASAPSLSPGDVVLIYNPADFSFAPFDNHYRDGEFARVLSRATNTVTLTKPLYATHPTTVQMYKVNPIRTGISGARITGIQNKRAVTVNLGTGLQFSDLDMKGSNYSHLEIKKCYEVHISDVRAVDYSPSSGLNYGITLSNSQTVYVDHVYLETTRHGFVTGGDAEVGCVPCRDIRVSDSYLNGVSTGGVTGCNVHGNIEWAWFTNCTMPNGFNPAGDHIFVEHCAISSGTSPYIVYAGSMLGADIQFTDCDFRATRNHPANTAMVYLAFNNMGLTRTGGTVKVTGAIDMGPYTSDSGTTTGIFVYNDATAGDLPADNHVEIDIRARSTATPTGTYMWGAAVRAGVGRGFRTVRLRVVGNVGAYANSTGAELVDLSGCRILNAQWEGIRAIHPSGAAYPEGEIVLRDVVVKGARSTGVLITGSSGGTDVTVTLDNVTSLNNNQGGGSAYTDASMYVFRVDRVIRRNCVVGDTQAVPTQVNIDAFGTVTTLIDEDTVVLGTLTSRYLSAITNHHYRGRGAGAPTLTAANGSTYLRTDGAAGSTFYVREGGAWVAK